LNSQEELALPLRGKKNRLSKEDFFVYFAKERLELTQKSIDKTVNRIISAYAQWNDTIHKCFLTDAMKAKYIYLLDERYRNLDLMP